MLELYAVWVTLPTLISNIGRRLIARRVVVCLSVLLVAANSVSSSALEVLDASVTAAPESRQVDRRVAPVTTVDALALRHELPDHGALLKVDTQGFEWQVLDGAAESLGRFDLLLRELSLAELYAGQKLWLEMVARMDAAGFGVWALQPEFIDPGTGRTPQVNGLFHRRARSPA